MLMFIWEKLIFYSSLGIHGKKTGQNVTEQVDSRRLCLLLPGVRGGKEQNLWLRHERVEVGHLGENCPL